MKKLLPFLIILMTLCMAAAVSADQNVHVVFGETYYCGDSFEVRIIDEPQMTTAITRSPRGRKVIQAQAGKYDILLQIHMHLRNMTPVVYQGLSPESFKLVGYVRGRPIPYYPEIMEPYDYGGREFYRLYDKNYYKTNPFPPLRNINMLLVYRVNPILRDWELHLNPKSSNGDEDKYLSATYYEMDIEPCDGIFQIITIRDAETGEITKYYR